MVLGSTDIVLSRKALNTEFLSLTDQLKHLGYQLKPRSVQLTESGLQGRDIESEFLPDAQVSLLLLKIVVTRKMRTFSSRSLVENT